MIFRRNFKPGFKIKLHHKDLHNALSTGKDLGVPMPLSSFVQQVFVSLITEGKGEEDHSALATFFEKIAKTEIKSSWSPPKGMDEYLNPHRVDLTVETAYDVLKFLEKESHGA